MRRILTAFLFMTLVTALAPAQPVAQWCHDLPRPEYAKLEKVDVASSWFEVYRVAPGVFAIYEPHQFEEAISYLILGQSSAVLFDTGMGIAKISDITARLTKLPITVLNSHTHFDHIGGNAEFPNILGRHTIFTSIHAKGTFTPALRHAYAHEELAPESLCGALPAGVTAESFSVRPFHISHYLRDHQRLQLGGRELEVIFTPGHTPDSICLLDRKNGLLFTGDTFYAGPIYLFEPETDMAAYESSVKKLAALQLGLKLLLPGHNTPAADPANLTRLANAVQSVRSGEAKGTLKEGHQEYVFQGFSLLLAAH
jgi:glyoxylase-like metal-dependent hydrolase (beta-lactamase superfamily II)